MKITDRTPKQAPVPHTYDITASDAETSALVQSLKSQFGAILPADIADSEVFSFINIRFVNRPGEAQTACIQAQLVAPPESPRVVPPAPSRTVPAPSAITPPASPVSPSAKV